MSIGPRAYAFALAPFPKSHARLRLLCRNARSCAVPPWTARYLSGWPSRLQAAGSVEKKGNRRNVVRAASFVGGVDDAGDKGFRIVGAEGLVNEFILVHRLRHAV